MEINLLKLSKLPKVNLAVEVKPSFKDKIKNKILNENFISLAKELKIQPARLYEYFVWEKSFIPINVLFYLLSKFNIPAQKIEKNIMIYKQLYIPIKNSVKNPKLPIKIHPYLTSIIAHLFFDGSVPNDGKGTYYNQKNKEIMNLFINKIKYIFGDVYYILRLDHKKVLKCRMPRIIGEICRGIYNVNSFGSFDARIPKKVFNLKKEHKIAFILSAILDEGSIAYSGDIMFGICNKSLCQDVKKLCNEVGIETTNVKRKSKTDYYYIYIKSKDKLLNYINLMNKKYPLISLNYKEERLRKASEIKKQKFYYTKDFADKRRSLILKELKNKCSVNYLASKHLIPPKTIRRYMYKFMKEGKVKRKKVSRGYLYYL